MAVLSRIQVLQETYLAKGSLRERFATGAFWSTIGSGAAQALMLLTSVIAARILGRERFGEYGMIMTTVGMFGVFAGFGLGTTATKFVAQWRYTDPKRAGRIIALSTLVALATATVTALSLLVLAPLIAAKALAAPQLSGLLRLGAGVLFLSAFGSAQFGVLAGFEAFPVIARINLAAGVITVILVGMGTLFWGPTGALAAQLASAAASAVLAHLAINSEVRVLGISVDYSGCLAERNVLVRFSLPAVLSGLMVTPVSWVCAAILVNQPKGYAEMALFNASLSWQRALLFLPGAVGAIALPLLAQLHGANERSQYRRALQYSLLLNAAAGLTALAVIVLMSGPIMRIYGASFEAGTAVLVLLSVSGVLIAVGNVIGNAISSSGNMWFGFGFNALWGVAYIGLAAVLVPGHGALGLASANLIAYIMHSGWQLLYLNRL